MMNSSPADGLRRKNMGSVTNTPISAPHNPYSVNKKRRATPWLGSAKPFYRKKQKFFLALIGLFMLSWIFPRSPKEESKVVVTTFVPPTPPSSLRAPSLNVKEEVVDNFRQQDDVGEDDKVELNHEAYLERSSRVPLTLSRIVGQPSDLTTMEEEDEFGVENFAANETENTNETDYGEADSLDADYSEIHEVVNAEYVDTEEDVDLGDNAGDADQDEDANEEKVHEGSIAVAGTHGTVDVSESVDDVETHDADDALIVTEHAADEDDQADADAEPNVDDEAGEELNADDIDAQLNADDTGTQTDDVGTDDGEGADMEIDSNDELDVVEATDDVGTDDGEGADIDIDSNDELDVVEATNDTVAHADDADPDTEAGSDDGDHALIDADDVAVVEVDDIDTGAIYTNDMNATENQTLVDMDVEGNVNVTGSEKYDENVTSSVFKKNALEIMKINQTDSVKTPLAEEINITSLVNQTEGSLFNQTNAVKAKTAKIPKTKMKDEGTNAVKANKTAKIPKTKMKDAGTNQTKETTLEQPLLDIAWLMSFPNSGTSYTLSAVRRASTYTTATNYGREKMYSGASVSVGQNGPFLHRTDMLIPPLIFTKTHCGGYCGDCWPHSYLQNQEDFEKACTATRTAHDVDGKIVRASFEEHYNISRVTKAVHIFRDPFDNVVSRFHLEINEQKKKKTKEAQKWLMKYPRNAEGFRYWCANYDKKFASEEANLVPVASMFPGVMCKSEFSKYVQWHNLASSVTQLNGIEVHKVYYEDLDKDRDVVINGILNFLGMEFKGVYKDFHLSDYSGYYTPDQRAETLLLIKAMANYATIINLARYTGETDAQAV